MIPQTRTSRFSHQQMIIVGRAPILKITFPSSRSSAWYRNSPGVDRGCAPEESLARNETDNELFYLMRGCTFDGRYLLKIKWTSRGFYKSRSIVIDDVMISPSICPMPPCRVLCLPRRIMIYLFFPRSYKRRLCRRREFFAPF